VCAANSKRAFIQVLLMKSTGIAVFLTLVGSVGAAQLKVVGDTTYESGAARAPVYGYEITYKSTHQIDDIYFVKNGARTIPFMESYPDYGGCTLDQPGSCNNGRQSPWDTSGKADNSGCWSFTTHSILCDHDITSDEVHIEFWNGGYSSTSGFTVKSLDAAGSVIGTVADVGARSGVTACNALDGVGTATTCPASPPTTYTQPTAATDSPTSSPSPSPTASPSLAPTAPNTAGMAKAAGDPHLVNVFGQRFDIYKPGTHVLVQVPKGVGPNGTLLRLEADARQVGGACAETYFKCASITGKWVPEAGGRQFCSHLESEGRIGSEGWMQFGKVQVKVVNGVTKSNTDYLNIFVKHLGDVGYPVGGLLGEDDHMDASTVSPHCRSTMELRSDLAAVAVAMA